MVKIRLGYSIPVLFILFQVLSKYFAGGICGFDKEGSPVTIELFGNVDWQGLLKSVKKSDFEKYRFWLSERDRKYMKKQSEKVNIIEVG